MHWQEWNPPIGWSLAVIAAAAALWWLLHRIVQRFSAAWPVGRTDNGIRVGAPKVYDNRALALMIEQLGKQLEAVKSIDEGSIKTGFGTIQGETASDWSSTVDANAASGKKSDSSTKTNPASPGNGQTGASKDSPFKFSERPLQLLTDQVSLQYEIFNLRLLLERALSDRLTGKATRLQAVIGVPISIDPPPYAIGCAATVELKVDKNVSLVALFPQEETFNTWGVDRRRFQLTGAGAAPRVSGKANLQAGKQASFLRRQAEVVTMEREAAWNELIVAWQFRPAPGGRSVSAGLRHMLMVLALPDADVGESRITMQASVRSSWQKWNAGSETAGRGVGWRALWSDRWVQHNWGVHKPFDVPTTEFIEQNLAPVIDSIEWARVGGAKAAIIVKGRNFFSGTKVLVGGKALESEPDLTIKSERSIQILASMSALAEAVVLSGRYGASKPLLSPPDTNLRPMRIISVSAQPSPDNNSYGVTVLLSTADGSPLNWDIVRKLPDPVFFINGVFVPELLVFDPIGTNQLLGSVLVTRELLPAMSASFMVRWPFYGDDWSLYYQTQEPKEKVAVTRVTAARQKTILLLHGICFEDGSTIVLDQTYAISLDGPLTRIAKDLLRLELSTDLISSYPECFLCRQDQQSLRIRIPQAQLSFEPALDATKLPLKLAPGTFGAIELAGTGLDTVVGARLDGSALPFVAKSSGASLSVSIDRKSALTEGKHELRLSTESGKELIAPIQADANPPKVSNGH